MANINRREAIAALSAAAILGSCNRKQAGSHQMHSQDFHDVHSFSQPDTVRVRHVALDLTASFDDRKLSGTADLSIERRNGDTASPLILDTRDLTIHQVHSSSDGSSFRPAK